MISHYTSPEGLAQGALFRIPAEKESRITKLSGGEASGNPCITAVSGTADFRASVIFGIRQIEQLGEWNLFNMLKFALRGGEMQHIEQKTVDYGVRA